MTRRKPQLKIVYRKTKIVLTCRGRVVFSAKGYRAFADIESFKAGWYENENKKVAA